MILKVDVKAENLQYQCYSDRLALELAHAGLTESIHVLALHVSAGKSSGEIF